MGESIHFAVSAALPQSPDDIASAILDLSRWPEFTGWGPIPGVRSASWLVRTDDIVGSVIAVTNTDGSTHQEEITAWAPPDRLALRLFAFSRPLSLLAREFTEVWDFESVESSATTAVRTHARRTFELSSRSIITRPAVAVIGAMLYRAIIAQMTDLACAASIGEDRAARARSTTPA